jgi:hypothetical protein
VKRIPTIEDVTQAAVDYQRSNIAAEAASKAAMEPICERERKKDHLIFLATAVAENREVDFPDPNEGQ